MFENDGMEAMTMTEALRWGKAINLAWSEVGINRETYEFFGEWREMLAEKIGQMRKSLSLSC